MGANKLPYELPLPAKWRNSRWKVKIREKENLEPPHVTILRRTESWRIDLRTGEFMDVEPDPSEVPLELVQLIKSSDCWALLCQEWDQKYPTNPVLAVDHDGSDSKKEKAE